MATARRLRRDHPGHPSDDGPASKHRRTGTGRDQRHWALPAWAGTRGARALAGGLASLLVALAIVVVHRPDGVPRLTVLDVGQGDAILLQGSRGGRLLIDGGPDPGRLLIALDEYLPPWDRRIDLVILSHPHEDHAAGLAALLTRYAVRRVLEPGMLGPGPGYAALNADLIARGIARGTLATGDRLSVDEVRLRVLWPDPGSVPERPPDGGTGINNVSIVLLGEVEGHRMLLAGDIEEQIDPTLLARGLPSVEVLKVAHHGSRTSSTGPFLAVARPQVAVVSAGRGNPYGHPAPATVERLRAAGARVLRTDDDGSVTVDLGPGPIRVRTGGRRAGAAVALPPTAAAGGGRAAANLLCGLPRASTDLAGRVAAAGRSAAAASAASASAALAAPGSIAADRPFGPSASAPSGAGRLGYASVRDDSRAQSAALPIAGSGATRARGLLLGRRRLRHRGGGRSLQERSRPLPGWRSRALAGSRRAWGWRPPPG
ncbi:MAG: MBL fold metallo-hydrolase [Chloroflexi bacterium]|nr:MBL fold metallo-hydrolase [Chloroflexota bacterium]